MCLAKKIRKYDSYAEEKFKKNLSYFILHFEEDFTYDTFIEFDQQLEKILKTDSAVLNNLIRYFIYYAWFNEWSFQYKKKPFIALPLENTINVDFGLIDDIIKKTTNNKPYDLVLKNMKNELEENEKIKYAVYIIKYMLIIRSCSGEKFYIINKRKDTIESSKILTQFEIDKFESLTQGWFIVINQINFNNKSIDYINKDIRLTPALVKYKLKTTAAKEVLNPENYSNSIFIKNKSILYENIDEIFKNNKIDNTILLKVINRLNRTPLTFDFVSFEKIYQWLDKYSITKITIIDKNNETSDYVLEIIKKEVGRMQYFLNENKIFFLQYVYDHRWRIYVQNIPINYQLFKILRGNIKIYKNFSTWKKTYHLFNQKYKVMELLQTYKILYVQNLDVDDLNLVACFLKKKNFCATQYIKNGEMGNDINNLLKLLEIECAISVLIRISKKKNDLKSSIKEGINVFNELIKINDLNAILTRCDNNPDKIIETITMVEHLKKWENVKFNCTQLEWYNDASSSVIQILLTKLFVYNENILKMCNIFDNDTQYKDIYQYVEKQLKEKNPKWAIFISRTLIKKKIMPSAYGQTYIKLIDEVENLLKNNIEWSKISKNDKKKFIDFINIETWKCLNKEGELILEYLKLCKRLAYEKPNKCVWLDKNKIPVILWKEKILDRLKIRKNIIKKKKEITAIEEILKKTKENEPFFDIFIKEKNKIKKKINELNEKLVVDDKNYLRKNIPIKVFNQKKLIKKYIKIRFKKKNKEIDINKLSKGLCASTNHNDDAFILINTLEKLRQLNIYVLPIHDSIGSELIYSPIIKILYKLSFIEFLEKSLNTDQFPINLLREEFNKKNVEELRNNFIKTIDNNKCLYLNNIEIIKKKIMESKDLFN